MSWTQPRPQVSDDDGARLDVSHELYDRLKAFGTVTVGAISVGANATTDTTITLTSGSGIRAGMAIGMSPPAALPSGVVYGGTLASDTDELVLRMGNCSATPQTVSSGDWSYWGMII